MMFDYIDCLSVTDAFEKAYNIVDSYGEVVESRIGRTKHLTDITLCVNNPYQGICLNPTRNMSLRYMAGEILWYISGSNKVADISKYGKMWESLSDDGITVNSAYGYRIFNQFGFNQLKFVVEKLKSNLHDRQAVIHIKDASDKPTKDTPCTCLIQFTVYHNRLNAHVYMRSNDIWLGIPYDMAFFTCLQSIVAHELGIPVGRYYHTVGDLHLYEKHWNKDVRYTAEDIGEDLAYAATDEGLRADLTATLNAIENNTEPDILVFAELWRMNQCKTK